MKSKYLILGISIFVIVFAIGLKITLIILNQDTIKTDVTYEIIENNTKEINLYLSKERNYYLYSLDEVKVTYQNETKPLKDWLNELSLETLLEGFKKENNKDGGTILYTSNNINILVCHKLLEEGKYNNDVYIGNKNMVYKEEFCKGE